MLETTGGQEKTGDSTKRVRAESDYLLFKKGTIEELDLTDDTVVYLPLGKRQSRSRMNAIREQAQADDVSGKPYAAVAAVDLTEHAPEKKVGWV